MGLRERAEAPAGIPGELDIEAAKRNGFTDTGSPRPAIKDSDLKESGVPSGMDVPVHVAWGRVMQDVQWLGKNRNGRDYKYRGIDDVMNLVGPALRKHGVFVMPAGIEPEFTVINTKTGAAMNYCRATVRFTIYGPTGDTMPAEVLGEGFDTGDKSGSKAQSIALRTLLLNGLAIQTNEPERDTEYGQQHEIAGPSRPTAEQYAAMILDERTSINRLGQIKQELYSDRELGSTTVEDIDGKQVRLVDLVRRVGMERKAAEQQA